MASIQITDTYLQSLCSSFCRPPKISLNKDYWYILAIKILQHTTAKKSSLKINDNYDGDDGDDDDDVDDNSNNDNDDDDDDNDVNYGYNNSDIQQTKINKRLNEEITDCKKSYPFDKIETRQKKSNSVVLNLQRFSLDN